MIQEQLKQALSASRQLIMLDNETINHILSDAANALLESQQEVLDQV